MHPDIQVPTYRSEPNSLYSLNSLYQDSPNCTKRGRQLLVSRAQLSSNRVLIFLWSFRSSPFELSESACPSRTVTISGSVVSLYSFSRGCDSTDFCEPWGSMEMLRGPESTLAVLCKKDGSSICVKFETSIRFLVRLAVADRGLHTHWWSWQCFRALCYAFLDLLHRSGRYNALHLKVGRLLRCYSHLPAFQGKGKRNICPLSVGNVRMFLTK